MCKFCEGKEIRTQTQKQRNNGSTKEVKMMMCKEGLRIISCSKNGEVISNRTDVVFEIVGCPICLQARPIIIHELMEEVEEVEVSALKKASEHEPDEE